MFYTVLLILIVAFCFYMRRKYTYWKRKAVVGPEPWPFFGNIFNSFTKKKTVGQIFRELYLKYDEYPVVGVYRCEEPVLIVRDPEFIARILVKDAKYFYNNDFFVDKNLDPLQGASPFVQKDQEAKGTRQMLSPGFTSGKTRNLFTLIIDHVNCRLRNYLESQPDIGKGQSLETNKLCRRYTLDNVALCAFGIDGKCFNSEESEFMKLANAFINPGTFALTMLQTFPIISKLISLKVIPKETEDGLTKIVTDVLEYRKRNNIVVNDYLQFISELKQKKGFSYTEVTAHATTFFEDGYETSALVMGYLLFNLSQNQEAQQKIREEINTFEAKNEDKKIAYEDIPEMAFLNACIYESMRLCPVLEHYTRVCSQSYVYETANEAPAHLTKMAVNIDAGTVCIVPFGGLCHDKRYFPEPEKFNPERFLDKNNNNFKGLFYPFGGGHRVCLGQRFGLMQVRTGIIEVIKNFEVTLSSETRLPFEFLPWTVLNKVKHGIWLKYKKIK